MTDIFGIEPGTSHSEMSNWQLEQLEKAIGRNGPLTNIQAKILTSVQTELAERNRVGVATYDAGKFFHHPV